MNISLKRSGGFAGLQENLANIDTAKLPASEAQRLEQSVQGLGFFDLPAAISAGGVGADFFRYEITVVQGERRHSVAFADDDSPATAQLRGFVETLIAMG